MPDMTSYLNFLAPELKTTVGQLIDRNPQLDGSGDGFTGTVQTVDATVTTVASYVPPDLKTTLVRAWVVHQKSDNSQGSGYELIATFRRSGATVTQIGSTTQVAVHEDVAGNDATIDTSGGVIRVRVTGAAATTLNWRCQAVLKFS